MLFFGKNSTIFSLKNLLIIGFLLLYSCSNKGKEEDARWTNCDNLEIKYPGEGSLRIHPFPIDSGYLFVVPSLWKDQVSVTTNNKETAIDSDSVQIKYSKYASVFVNTVSGSMKAVNASIDHEYREPGAITIIDSTGNIICNEELQFIKGRGNSSWLKDKKSYNIKSGIAINPLGLKRSKSFNLVSTHGITNGLALQIAQEFGTSSPIAFSLVNLYLNGHYQGLYLLTNKVDISHSSVDIQNLDKLNKENGEPIKTTNTDDNYKYVAGISTPEDYSGGYLIEVMNFEYKYDRLPCGFITQDSLRIRFKSPQRATKQEVLYIRNLYHEFYDAIKTPSGYHPTTGRYYSDYIDLESFAKYYLVEEALSNMDAGYGNLYFYKNIDAVDPKIYAGPIWDMEWSMGINSYPYFRYPEAFNLRAGSSDESQKLFYYLFQHDDFKVMVDSLFQQELFPILQKYFFADSVENDLNNDGTLNYLRWPGDFRTSNDEFSQLCSYMRPHISFLKKVLSPYFDFDDYCQVRVDAGYLDRCIMFLVHRGDNFELPDFPWVATDGSKKKKDGWYENNQKLEDPIQQINENKYYKLRWINQEK